MKDSTHKKCHERYMKQQARKNDLELRTRMLLRNGITSKSGMTLADTEVLKAMALRLGYDLESLETLDITDSKVNPFARLK